MSIKLLPFAVIASAALMNAAPAKADHVQFSYQAHELQTEGGAEMLFKRIESRARIACVNTGVRPLTVRAAEQACEDAMVSDLVAKIDHTRLHRLYARVKEERAYAALND